MQKNNQHNVKMEFGNMHKNGVLNLYITHKRIGNDKIIWKIDKMSRFAV